MTHLIKYSDAVMPIEITALTVYYYTAIIYKDYSRI